MTSSPPPPPTRPVRQALRRRQLLRGAVGLAGSALLRTGAGLGGELVRAGAGLGSAVGLAGCASWADDGVPSATTAVARAASHVALSRLFEAADEAQLQRRPMEALYRGDLRHADRHGDTLSPAAVAAELAAAQDELAALARIPRQTLGPVDQLAYDSFAWQRQHNVRENSAPLGSLWPLLPINPYDNGALNFAQLSSGAGVAPFDTPRDYDNGLGRLQGFVAHLLQVEQRSREGMARGVVQPRVIVGQLVAQLDGLLAPPLARSPFMQPLASLPPEWPPGQRQRLQRDVTAVVGTQVLPALRRLRDFLAGPYLAAARQSVGLADLPGGEAWYRQLVARHTASPLSAEQIHELGLAEVSRIRQAMDALRRQQGFAGDLNAFLAQVRDDPRLRPQSEAALLAGYAAIGERVALALPRLFHQIPDAPLAIRAMPGFMAHGAAAAHYQSGSAERQRPGVFYVNTSDLPARNMHNMETLYLHEAVPGHHLQISLTERLVDLPLPLRFGEITAYTEGWALYAESLGPELGLFSDPMQRFGHLDDEMLRAMRLVVDTGLHLQGWSRGRAMAYMQANSALSAPDVAAEVDRYIVNPAQALAYKVGQLTLQRLRRRAEWRLGRRLDIRAFHDQLLDTGNLPLHLLEAKVEDWLLRVAWPGVV